jgi:hypothetical protein
MPQNPLLLPITGNRTTQRCEKNIKNRIKVSPKNMIENTGRYQYEY